MEFSLNFHTWPPGFEILRVYSLCGKKLNAIVFYNIITNFLWNMTGQYPLFSLEYWFEVSLFFSHILQYSCKYFLKNSILLWYYYRDIIGIFVFRSAKSEKCVKSKNSKRLCFPMPNAFKRNTVRLNLKFWPL